MERSQRAPSSDLKRVLLQIEHRHERGRDVVLLEDEEVVVQHGHMVLDGNQELVGQAGVLVIHHARCEEQAELILIEHSTLDIEFPKTHTRNILEIAW